MLPDGVPNIKYLNECESYYTTSEMNYYLHFRKFKIKLIYLDRNYNVAKFSEFVFVIALLQRTLKNAGL